MSLKLLLFAALPLLSGCSQPLEDQGGQAASIAPQISGAALGLPGSFPVLN